MEPCPVPAAREAMTVLPAPAGGGGNWVGAPSAALDDDGGFVVAYRVRTAAGRGSATVVARHHGTGPLTTLGVLAKDRFGAESLERPALVRTPEGGWRLYVSCATPGSKHWRVDALDAPDPAALAEAEARTAFPGDDLLGVKDPVIRRGPGGWEAWVCCHPLDEPGEEDRMHTRHATSPDGLVWRWDGTALAGREGEWDARGARVTAVLPDGRAFYDGRASKEENFSERTGVAGPSEVPGRLAATGKAPMMEGRYLDVVALPAGGYRMYWEEPLPDGSHELRMWEGPCSNG